MATIAKKCSVCGKLYKAYNYVEIPVSREDDEDQEYDDDEAIDVEVTEDFEPIDFHPNGFEFVTIKEDMDIQYDFDNQDLCPECMAVISNFIDTNTPHASGNPVILEDAAPGTPIEMVVDIQPSQDLHGYDHPWVGGAGKNLYKTLSSSSTVNGITYTVNDDGSITLNGTTTTYTFREEFGSLKAGTYILSGNNSSAISIQLRKRSDDTYIGGATTGPQVITLSEDVEVKFRIVTSANNTVNNVTIYPQLELGTTATSYAPYENICPITGHDEVNATRTGFNQWDEEWETGTYNTSTGAKSSTTAGRIRSANYISCKPNTAYYVVKPPVDAVLFYGSEKEYIGYTTTLNVVITPNECHYMTFYSVTNYGTTYNHDICINLSSDRNGEYEPYQSQTVTVELNDTVYGGTLNVATGELVVDRAFYTWSSGGTLTSTKAFSLAKSDAVQINASNQTTLKGAICDKMQSGTWADIANRNATSMYAGCAWGTALAFRVPGYTTAEEYLAFLAENPLQFAYLLKEPQTYHLTLAQIRLLKGSNTIETDAGTLTIKYKKAIEGKMEVES